MNFKGYLPQQKMSQAGDTGSIPVDTTSVGHSLVVGHQP